MSAPRRWVAGLILTSAVWPAGAAATLPGPNGLLAYGTPTGTFASSGGGPAPQVHLVAPDGSNDRQVTDTREYVGRADWSADGRRLAVTRRTTTTANPGLAATVVQDHESGGQAARRRP